MDDTPIFKPAHVPKNEVVLGTYGSTEWVNATVRRDSYMAGGAFLEYLDILLTEPGFTLQEWVIKEGFKSFTMFESNQVLVPFEDGLLTVITTKGKINVTTAGTPEFTNMWRTRLLKEFKKAENLISWVYNTRGDIVTVPLNYRKGINAAYPWLGRDYADYIKDYLTSESCVLILIGPPGTGKTTFIKNLIHQSGGGARVAYDEKVLGGDDFFAQFIDSQDDIMVMEDADAFLQSRADGNSMMHKFLNVSDGLISAAGKKMIFSTNLPNISDIDEALLRTGRCYDTIQFRPLNRTEALAVLAEVNSERELQDGSEFTLATIFTSQPLADSTTTKRMGF